MSPSVEKINISFKRRQQQAQNEQSQQMKFSLYIYITKFIIISLLTG